MLELVLALTLGLGAGGEPGQAEEWRVSGRLELLVSGSVCVWTVGSGEVSNPSYTCLFGAYSAHLARLHSTNLQIRSNC